MSDTTEITPTQPEDTMPTLDALMSDAMHDMLNKPDYRGKRADAAQYHLFCHYCVSRGLNPITRQAYLMSNGAIGTGIDGFRAIASRTGRYVPGRATEYGIDDRGAIESATVFVKVMASDGPWHEVAETAYMGEFRQNTPPWKNMPRVMISKVAEARALRRAFPDDLSGLYESTELAAGNLEERRPVIEATAETRSLPASSTPKQEALHAMGEWTGMTGSDLASAVRDAVERCGFEIVDGQQLEDETWTKLLAWINANKSNDALQVLSGGKKNGRIDAALTGSN